MTVTRLLHACYAIVTRLLHDCYTTVTQVGPLGEPIESGNWHLMGDVDHDGKISLEEAHNVELLFDELDCNGDGRMDPKECGVALKTLRARAEEVRCSRHTHVSRMHHTCVGMRAHVFVHDRRRRRRRHRPCVQCRRCRQCRHYRYTLAVGTSWL